MLHNYQILKNNFYNTFLTRCFKLFRFLGDVEGDLKLPQGPVSAIAVSKSKRQTRSQPYQTTPSRTPSPPAACNIVPIEEEPLPHSPTAGPNMLSHVQLPPAAFNNLPNEPTAPDAHVPEPVEPDVDITLSQIFQDLVLPPAEPVRPARQFAYLDASHASGQVIHFADGPLSNPEAAVIEGFDHSQDDQMVSYLEEDGFELHDMKTDPDQGPDYPTSFD